MSFQEIHSILKANSSTKLPFALDELQKQPTEEYTLFYRAVTRDEQVAVNACKQRATDAARKLKPLGKSTKKEALEFRAIAIKNLVEIRDRQLAFALFEGVETRNSLVSFRARVYQCKNVDALRVALEHKDQFTCPFRRLNLFYFLERALPQDHQKVANHAIELLVLSKNPDDVNSLFGMLADIPQQDRPLFLQELVQFLRHISSEEWHTLVPILAKVPGAQRSLYVRETCALFLEETGSNPEEVKAALEAVVELGDPAPIVAISRQITRQCFDGEYIGSVVRQVASYPIAARQDVVERVLRVMAAATSGILFYETLTKFTNLAPSQMNFVEEEIKVLFGNYFPEDSDEVLAILDQVQRPPSVEQIARMSVVVPEDNIDAYRMTLARQDLYENPLQVLENLVELFQARESNDLHITFLGVVAEDDGALSQEFIATLVSEVCKKLNLARRQENGLYRPENAALKQEEKRALEGLGELLRFLLNSRRQYLIGQLFDMSVFHALKHLTEAHLTGSIENNFDGFLGVYEKMCQEFSVDQNEIVWMKRAQNRELAVERLEGVLTPCIAIKRGMLASRLRKVTEQELEASELFLKLQGRLSNDYVISQVRFKPGIPERKQRWVLDWLSHVDKEAMKRFLRGLTGGTSLGQKELYISNTAGNFKFDSCKSVLYIPFDILEEQAAMASLIEGEIPSYTDI